MSLLLPIRHFDLHWSTVAAAEREVKGGGGAAKALGANGEGVGGRG